ncbi:antibiotic biosynthesis monooxygenase family protein [Rhizobium alvei]|uniref:ABM domain-containing protein n=1 Tax=Rhizobium alvei TaxID=1132659 RepID=A0ABT8YNC1_9HYPH|nr:hypothetical protein [Rhizobium alvei]MDO6964762.1 hypothetical protein [Rhizobium alvei]
MQDTIIELARIKLKDGIDEARLVETSERFQRAFLDRVPGFLGRELMKADDGSYMDLVHWQSSIHADAAMKQASESVECRDYFGLMDMSDDDPHSGVRLFQLLADYPAH